MIDLGVSVLPFILIGVANFILSWIYYSPIVPWFRAWQIGVGADLERTEMTEEEKKAMPRLMGGAVIASFYCPMVYKSLFIV
jgi:UDP-N-acetylmuramyl pentapeptide phosphotransferase/UDP-N-acetylglucosamine-1-phosphate transferase